MNNLAADQPAANTTPATRQPRLHRSTKWFLLVFLTGLTLTSTTRILVRSNAIVVDAIPTSVLVMPLVVGLVLMLGNIIVTEAWLYAAERSGDREVLRFAARTTNWADVFFTAPGIYLMVISGLLLIEQTGVSAGWLLAAEISFVLAGVTWLFCLVPMQNRLALRATAGQLDSGFLTILHRWYPVGLLATGLTILAAGFVIFQPAW